MAPHALSGVLGEHRRVLIGVSVVQAEGDTAMFGDSGDGGDKVKLRKRLTSRIVFLYTSHTCCLDVEGRYANNKINAEAEEYYGAAGAEDWAYTYEHLVSEAHRLFTREEWFLRTRDGHQAHISIRLPRRGSGGLGRGDEPRSFGRNGTLPPCDADAAHCVLDRMLLTL